MSKMANDKGGCKRVCLSQPFVQEMGHSSTVLGEALYIKVRTEDYRQLSWSELASVFNDRYPDRWALQAFPPKYQVLDEANVYHLFVLEDEPLGFNINRRLITGIIYVD